MNIGDGLLDANAYPSSDAFIGYVGVVQKKKAMEKAMLFVDSFDSLIHILSENECSCLFPPIDWFCFVWAKSQRMPFAHFLIESHPDQQQYQWQRSDESDWLFMYWDYRNVSVSRASLKQWQFGKILIFQIVLAASVIGVPLAVFPLTGFFSLRKLRKGYFGVISFDSSNSVLSF